MSVLIVEDDEGVRESVASILREEGYAVEVAESGAQALERLARHRPTLILLDLMMPVMNGWELRAAMLADHELARVPVVVVSGKGRIPPDEEQTLAPAAVLVKPFELSELLELVARYCAPGQADAAR